MFLKLRDQQLKTIIYRHRYLDIYKLYGNHKPKIYNRYTHKRERNPNIKLRQSSNHSRREKKKKQKELQKQRKKQ